MVFIRKKREKVEFTEQSIIDIVYANRGYIYSDYDMFIPNCYTQGDNEADLFAIRRNKCCDEFEVKISRSDFLNDFKKTVMYRKPGYEECWAWEACLDGFSEADKALLIEPWCKLKHDALRDGDMSTNYFWYVTPKGLIAPEEVPEPFGFIEINEFGEPFIRKKPVKLHNNRIDTETELKLVKKLAYRFWDYRRGRR